MSTSPLAARRPEIVLGILLTGCFVLSSLQVRTQRGKTAGEEMLLSATAPLVRLTAEIRGLATGAAERLSTRAALVSENTDLKRRLAEANAEMLRLRNAERDRARLLELFGPHPAPPAGTRAAHIVSLGGETSGLFRTALLDEGETAGIRPDSVVVAPSGVLGRVVAVGRSTSRVQLLSDRTAAAGVILPRTGRVAVVKGDGESGVNVNYVQIVAASEVAADDVIVTSGTDGIYPGNLKIGTISMVKRSSHSQYLELPVVLSADPGREQLVFVLPPVLPPASER